MKFTEKCWTLLISLLDAVTHSSVELDRNQQPIGIIVGLGHHPHGEAKGPVFSPPNGPDEFVCDYSPMTGAGWRSCSTPNDRECWLTDGTKRYDINTDYEAEWPTGVTRKYTLNVTDMSLAPDGYNNTGGKVFNNTYPGPWIRACWGDDIEVTVTNYLKYNGSESFPGLVPVRQSVIDCSS